LKYIDSHCGVEDNGREAIDALRRQYYGFAAYCDAQIGRLLDYLDAASLAEDTLVIFTTDHGQEYFDHGFNNKHVFYDASWRIPLILRYPGAVSAGERRGFASLTDVAATILEAAGASRDHVQGFDLLSPLREGAEARNCVPGALYFSLALATEAWKLIYHTQEDDGLLFNRHADPNEQNNLYDDPAYEWVRDKLLTALLKWRGSLTDVHHYQTITHAGPVIKRLMPHLMSLRGVDAEMALCHGVIT
jgi:arylsulfatase A-like enzyme